MPNAKFTAINSANANANKGDACTLSAFPPLGSDQIAMTEGRKYIAFRIMEIASAARTKIIPNPVISIAAMAMAIVMLTGYIRANAEVVNSVERIASLESRYLNLKADNDEEYSRIINSVDLNEVKRIAQEELGMHYATEGQIVKYTDEIGDYVKQYSDID